MHDHTRAAPAPLVTDDRFFESLGHILSFHGADLHDPAALREAIAARSYRNEVRLAAAGLACGLWLWLRSR